MKIILVSESSIFAPHFLKMNYACKSCSSVNTGCRENLNYFQKEKLEIVNERLAHSPKQLYSRNEARGNSIAQRMNSKKKTATEEMLLLLLCALCLCSVYCVHKMCCAFYILCTRIHISPSAITFYAEQ